MLYPPEFVLLTCTCTTIPTQSKYNVVCSPPNPRSLWILRFNISRSLCRESLALVHFVLNHVTDTTRLQGLPNIVDIQVAGSSEVNGGLFQTEPANITAENDTIMNFIFNGM